MFPHLGSRNFAKKQAQFKTLLPELPDTTWWTFPGISPTESRTLEAKVCSSDQTRDSSKGLNTPGKTRKKSGKLRATASQESGRGSLHRTTRSRERRRGHSSTAPEEKGLSSPKHCLITPKTREDALKYWDLQALPSEILKSHYLVCFFTLENQTGLGSQHNF